jgi:hypothetical protein
MKYTVWSEDIPGKMTTVIEADSAAKAVLKFAFLADDENWVATESLTVTVTSGSSFREKMEVAKDVTYRIVDRSKKAP